MPYAHALKRVPRAVRLATATLLVGLAVAQIGSPAGAQEAGDPVAGSVQHVYTAGAPNGIPSAEIPICVEPDEPPGCYAGERLVLQAKRIGQTAMEPTIAVASDGTAYMAGSTIVVDTPVAYGVAKTDARRSTDGGKTWTSIQPAV
ncbi:MAG TPA: hypothetical protein VEA19_00240, partial [Actinomycetota bacterium]|nr:hypothetical protein [Actinomycetota bacterium]